MEDALPDAFPDAYPDLLRDGFLENLGVGGTGVLESTPSSTLISLLNFGEETVVISTILRSRLLLRRSGVAVLIYS